jgi:hypothetical protein
MKINLSSKKVIIPALVLLVAASGYQAMNGYNEQQEQLAIKNKLALTQQLLKRTVVQSSSQVELELKDQISLAQSENLILLGNLKQSLETIEMNKSIFRLAEGHGVEIREIVSSPPENTSFEGVAFRKLRSQVTANGTAADLLSFVSAWTRTYPTGDVSRATYTTVFPQPVVETVPDNGTSDNETSTSDNTTVATSIVIPVPVTTLNAEFCTYSAGN